MVVKSPTFSLLDSNTSILNAIHPNIWKFIRDLQKEDKLTHLKMIQYCTRTKKPLENGKIN